MRLCSGGGGGGLFLRVELPPAVPQGAGLSGSEVGGSAGIPGGGGPFITLLF